MIDIFCEAGHSNTVVLWGIGTRGEEAWDLFLNNGVNVIAAIDSNMTVQGKTWHRVPVISFEEYMANYRDFVIIITPKEADSIEIMLKNNNVEGAYKFEEFVGYLMGSSVVKKKYSRIGANFQARLCSELLAKSVKKVLSCQNAAWSEDSPFGVLKEKINIIQQVCARDVVGVYKILFGGNISSVRYNNVPEKVDAVVIHGLSADYFSARLVIEAESRNVPIVFAEDGFIRSIEPVGSIKTNIRYRKSVSSVFCWNGTHINAKVSTCLERLLNSDRTLSKKEIKRAEDVIEKIRQEKVSKYNCQPDIHIEIGRADKPKVLIIDQVYGDKSIEYGLATEESYKEMFDEAVRDNPDADIIIKTHPQKSKGHFSWLQPKDNIFVIDYGMNPITLLEYVDKVYVCTSQMGFEALMCGKAVHVFGMPFYAGWGVTHDRLICPRRTKKRSVEEIFYMAYIEYSHYVSYKTNSECEIEQAIDEIIELRDEYWKEQEKRREI